VSVSVCVCLCSCSFTSGKVYESLLIRARTCTQTGTNIQVGNNQSIVQNAKEMMMRGNRTEDRRNCSCCTRI